MREPPFVNTDRKREKTEDRRERLSPVVARIYAEKGYDRTTTAEIARRCELQPNELFRLWPDKRTMFAESIRTVFDLTISAWSRVLKESPADSSATAAERLLTWQAADHGHEGFYTVVFSALLNADDPKIRREIKSLYKGFHRVISDLVVDHESASDCSSRSEGLTPSVIAWAVIGIGMIADAQRSLGLASKSARSQTITSVGSVLLSHAHAQRPPP